MVKSYKIHKLAGLSGGIFLLMLAITGFFLDHDNWKFLYTTTLKTSSLSLLKKDNRLLESYYIDKSNSNHIVVATLRGIYESHNGGKKFQQTLNEMATSIKVGNENIYVSTSNGIYILTSHGWQSFVLKGKYLTSFAIHENIAFVVEEKKNLYLVDLTTKKILKETSVQIDEKELIHDIKLSRFIRDLHYGRGLFDDYISLILNDYATLFLIFLIVSGYIIWFLIKRKKAAKISRKLIKFHANSFVIFASFFMLILAITGIFLDHSSSLAQFMRSVNISHKILPPIYGSLREDIWSVDYDGQIYRIGNRYGIYKSNNLKEWTLDNKGFSYRMIRVEEKLYISGMGAANRILKNNKYTILPNTPHMFKDIVFENNSVKYISSMKMSNSSVLPKYHNVTLFSVILSLHDGSFFAPWWIWINDFAAGLLIILVLTGSYRWYIKKM